MKQVNKFIVTVKVVMVITLLLAMPTIYAVAGPRGLSDPTGAPIDGGISLLVAAGIGYGAKKVRDARKKGAGIKKNETIHSDN